MQSCLSNSINNSVIISIKQEVINVLQLENNKDKNTIVNSLLKNGRQSLVMYKKDIVPKIYIEIMHSNKLLDSLKSYFQHQWKIVYGYSDKRFRLFVEEYELCENHLNIYECVLTRTAEYGNKYMKRYPKLSIVLQLLFEKIDDNYLQNTNVFDNLWFTITNEGIKSINKYLNYTSEKIMIEQINNKQSILFQTLRESYQSQLFLCLKLTNIENKDKLYDLVLDSVTEYGWLSGIQLIQEKILPIDLYKKLLSQIEILLTTRESYFHERIDNTASIYSDTEVNDKQQIPDNNEDIMTTRKTITVRFRPNNTLYQVCIDGSSTVLDVIINVCQQANTQTVDEYYLWFDSSELNIKEKIFQTDLCQIVTSNNNLSEVRSKYVKVLQETRHIGKQVFLASPEQVVYNELLNIALPTDRNNILPSRLELVAKQIAERTPISVKSSQTNNTVFISLPNFCKQSIALLPTIHLKVPLSPNQFDWNHFLENLASDLEIDRTNLIIVNARIGSTAFEIKLQPKVAYESETMRRIEHRLKLMVLPRSRQFIEGNTPSNMIKVDGIQVELKNFTETNKRNDTTNLPPNVVEQVLRLSERPAIIEEASWNFMTEKSRQITTGILQSIQSCPEEYVIDHASIVYNEKIFDKYQNFADIDENEKVLFHGTRKINFAGIFQKNFLYNSGAKRTDDGWYGQGIYFSNSPRKALNYAEFESNMSYLICSVVRLGKTLTVTDMRFKGKPMHPDYDTHYVPITIDGRPISQGETAAFEEFVVKRSEQIMPLYIIGIKRVFRFVMWRDAKITDEANANLFEVMKEQHSFNIYGAQTSIEALNILELKLSDENMECVVVTNGADDGEDFVRQCRTIRSTLPIIVYCKNKFYHQQWARTFSSPTIDVTTSPEKVFDFIRNTSLE